MNDNAKPQNESASTGMQSKAQEPRAVQRRSGPAVFSPFDEMERLFNEMSRGLTRPFGGWPDFGSPTAAPFEGRQPKVDLIDREDEIVLKAELPGVKKEDLEVTMGDNAVTIRASTSHEEEEEKGDYYRKEMTRGEFVRTVPIPETIDEGKVSASFKDGILELKMPKTEEARPRQIKVE